jgi:hypothetical protein
MPAPLVLRSAFEFPLRMIHPTSGSGLHPVYTNNNGISIQGIYL